MTYNEAIDKAEIDDELEKVKSVFEGPTLFVINVVSKNGERLFKPSIGVDKKTGKVSAFSPMHAPAGEMKNLKLVYGSMF